MPREATENINKSPHFSLTSTQNHNAPFKLIIRRFTYGFTGENNASFACGELPEHAPYCFLTLPAMKAAFA